MNPYQNFAYPGSPDPWVNPRQVESSVKIFGLSPPAICGARVLELGCADGANIIPFAVEFPNAEFVGVDIAEDRIAEAVKSADALSLDNTRFETQNLTEIDSSFGEFDYILCPGIFSWVTEAEKNSILEIIRHRLSPTGVAAVSYNIFPAWHHRMPVRDLIRRHTASISSPREQVAEARRFVDFLAQAAVQQTPESLAYRTVKAIFDCSADHYLYHDFLTDLNQPLYFHEFVSQLAARDLQFVMECELARTACPGLDAFALKTIDSAPFLEREQLIDCLTGTGYRRSIVCRTDQSLSRHLNHESVKGLYAAFRDSLDLTRLTLDSSRQTIGHEGTSVTTVEPVAKFAFRELAKLWPACVGIDELSQLAVANCDSPTPEACERTVRQALLAAAGSGLVKLFSTPPTTGKAGRTPKASTANRHFAASGGVLSDGWNRSVQLESSDERWLLSQLDGTKSLEELATILAERCIEQPGGQISDAAEFVAAAVQKFEQQLLLQASQA